MNQGNQMNMKIPNNLQSISNNNLISNSNNINNGNNGNMNMNVNMNSNMNMNVNNGNYNNYNNSNYNNNFNNNFNFNNINNNNSSNNGNNSSSINNNNNNITNNTKVSNFNNIDFKDKKDYFIEKLYKILNCDFLTFNFSFNQFKQDKIINYSDIQVYYYEVIDYISQNQHLSGNIDVLNLRLILITIIFEKIYFFFHLNNLYKYNIPNMSVLVDDIELIMEKRLDSIDTKNLYFFQNKLEFLYRYSKTFVFKNKNIPNDILYDFNVILNSKNSVDTPLIKYYYTVFLYLKNDLDMCNSEYFNQISNMDENNSNVNINIFNHYLRQKYIVINTKIEKDRKGYSLELQNLNSLLSLPTSNSIYNKVIHNIQDCYFIINDFKNAEIAVNLAYDFLKRIGLSGDNINYQLESNILVNLKKLYLRSIKNENFKDSNTLNSLNELEMIFKNLNDIFNSFKKNEYAKISKNESLETIKKYLTIYQLNYIFYCKHYDVPFNSGFISDLLKEDRNIFSNLKPEYFNNIFILKPNDQEVNLLFYNYFEKIILQTISNSNNYRAFDKTQLFYLNNRISLILNSMLSDSSSSKCKDYVKMITDLCKGTILIFKRIKSDELELKNSLFNILNCNLYLKIFSNIFFYYAFTYYYTDCFKEAKVILEDLNEYFSFLKNKKIISTILFDSRIEKLKADILFKESKFNDSLELYLKILKQEKDDYKSITLMHFNCGLIYINLIDISNAKLCFEKVKDNYEKIPQKKGNIVAIYEESCQILDTLYSL